MLRQPTKKMPCHSIILRNCELISLTSQHGCRWFRALAVVALALGLCTAALNLWAVARINRQLLPQACHFATVAARRQVRVPSPAFLLGCAPKRTIVSARYDVDWRQQKSRCRAAAACGCAQVRQMYMLLPRYSRLMS